MKRTELKPGRKSLERGSTFKVPRHPMKNKQRAVSPASPMQRAKARSEPCVASGVEAWQGPVVDPAHLCPRSHGGCDDPLCVVPLRRDLHRDFDDGRLDLLPSLVGRRTAELQHALGHYDGDILSLLHRLTGQRYTPSNPERSGPS